MRLIFIEAGKLACDRNSWKVVAASAANARTQRMQ